MPDGSVVLVTEDARPEVVKVTVVVVAVIIKSWGPLSISIDIGISPPLRPPSDDLIFQITRHDLESVLEGVQPRQHRL